MFAISFIFDGHSTKSLAYDWDRKKSNFMAYALIENVLANFQVAKFRLSAKYSTPDYSNNNNNRYYKGGSERKKNV